MNTIKPIILIILICVRYNTIATAQDLRTLTAGERDNLLISIAKEVVLKYGPDYYREYKPPVITKEPWSSGKHHTIGRTYYKVAILYDKTKELLGNYAAEVFFWEDTGLPHFYIAVWDTMDESKVTIEMDLHGSPCPPDLTALDFYFLIHKECSLHATISHHFARPCWDDTTCYHYSYTHYT